MSRDALIFYSEFDDPRAWKATLTNELPDLDFHTDPEAVDPANVHYALAWKPPSGFFSRFPNLKLVTNLGAGVDSLVGRNDLPDVPITRLSDTGMVSLMTSYVLFAAIRYARDIPIFERAQRRSEWRYVHPRALSDIRVGVLGLGELGTPAAAALAGVGFDVRGWSRSLKQIANVKCSAGLETLDTFLGETEILIILLPLTSETRGLLDAQRLSLLPWGAKLVNASRGAVVDETALIAALKSGQIAEATLDVFTVEPLPKDHVFWGMDNVLITPHLASITVPEVAAREVAESIRLVRQGLPPLHRIDPGRGY
ncbi:2-hydroxyacid dehydrogenase [Pseudorhodoplanes sinuspersici]|uniref:Glyoxylate/hydroxypyruvate reductase A n=1 Tax=Pseudorhodoplanes sinuspersici TaxID=1235591 RepID=A0A1W6ZTA4_9HYPH|nr:glyoxylate/hydroxypyruvate reductase A [Pseudorhodoplanes sinuspersici]ARQ00563.1 glyoxylate/hydroxypyruvate reductase A [Pseudorhodoplanes sinuspersici]RKE72159.1 glyoxylate/hydroxypyruvate reductase A [Pseudorhodoplanes sinuspersici]